MRGTGLLGLLAGRSKVQSPGAREDKINIAAALLVQGRLAADQVGQSPNPTGLCFGCRVMFSYRTQSHEAVPLAECYCGVSINSLTRFLLRMYASKESLQLRLDPQHTDGNGRSTVFSG